MVFLSVVVSAYNAEKTIVRCIESIYLACEHSSLLVEVIIVDDGSTDSTAKQIDAFCEDKTNFYIIRQANGGVSSARNHGVSVAKGKWLMFVDADDFVNPFIFQTLTPYFEQDNYDTLMFSCYVAYINKKIRMSIGNGDYRVEDILNCCIDGFSRETFLCTIWNKVYRTDIIKQHRIVFPEGIKFGEDFVFNCRYHSQTETIRFIDEPMYYYYCGNEESAVNKFYPDFDSFINKMYHEYNDMLQVKNRNTQVAREGMLQFISSRWLLATEKCVTGEGKASEKATTLNRWYSTMPDDVLHYITQMMNNSWNIFAKYKKNRWPLIVAVRLRQLRIWLSLIRKNIKRGGAKILGMR